MIQKTSSRWIVVIAIIITGLSSCHKTNSLQGPVAINIINAIPGSQPLIPVLGTTGAIWSYFYAANVPYGTAGMYTPLGGSTTIYVVQDATGDSVAPQGHSTGVFDGALTVEPYGMYSFFLAKDTVNADTLFVKDQIPVYADSMAGIRFVNLAPGSQGWSVNIEGTPHGSEVNTIGYKGVTGFLAHAAGAVASSNGYIFIVRDGSGDSLTSYQWMPSVFKSNTLVITGYPDSTGVQGVNMFAVNNF